MILPEEPMKAPLYLIVTFLLLAGCQEENEYLPTNFNYDIPPEEITEDVSVGAYYYPYETETWTTPSAFSPLAGEYRSLNPEVMTQQRDWAAEAGVNFFIFDWNNTPEDEALLNNFISGRNNAVQMVINFNLAHLNATPDTPLAGEKLDTLVSELRQLATEHFTKEYYFTTNGQPVVLISPINQPISVSGSLDFPAIISALREALTAAGVELYMIGEITEGWLPPQRYSESLRAMDAVVLKDWSTENYDRSVFFASYSDQNWSHWNDSTMVWGVDFVPCIFPGFTDKAMNPESVLYDIDRSEEFYSTYSQVAKRNMSDRRMVLINSWNNYSLGTAIEPTQEYGTTYLEITKSQFKVTP